MFDTMADHDDQGQLIEKRSFPTLAHYSWRDCTLGWEDVDDTHSKITIWERFIKHEGKKDFIHDCRKLGVSLAAETSIEILDQLCKRPEDLDHLPPTLSQYFYYALCAFLQLQYGDHLERMKPEIDQSPVWEALFYRHTDKDRCGMSVSKGVRIGCHSFIQVAVLRGTVPSMIAYANSFLLFKELTAASGQMRSLEGQQYARSQQRYHSLQQQQPRAQFSSSEIAGEPYAPDLGRARGLSSSSGTGAGSVSSNQMQQQQQLSPIQQQQQQQPISQQHQAVSQLEVPQNIPISDAV